MSTALFEVSQSIKIRKEEIDTLINGAVASIRKDPLLYKCLCRACCVMIASHLEGFLKDITKSLVRDFNYHNPSFSDMPAAMQRTFCERIAFYEGVDSKDIESRIRQLKAFFTSNSVSIDFEAFSYRQNANKNPSGDFIDSSFSKIGVPNIISCLSGSELEYVFDNDSRTNYKMLRDIKRLRSRVYHFPYRKISPDLKFDFSNARNSKKAQSSTIWHTYIEEVMSRRHQIAHGDTMENITDHETLREDALKMEVFMHGLVFISSEFLSKNV